MEGNVAGVYEDILFVQMQVVQQIPNSGGFYGGLKYPLKGYFKSILLKG